MAAIALLLLVSLGSPAFAVTLVHQKDALFAYAAVLANEDAGSSTIVDYDEMRDVNGRDEIPERRVKNKYVSLGVRRVQKDLTLQTAAGAIRHVAVGQTEGASLIVVYVHGQGGSRKQGVDDFTFGGNFNRVKNLVANSGGLYLSPDFSDFGAGGAAEVASLIMHYADRSPGAEVFVACGSAGGGICYELAKNAEIAKRMGGLLLLGSLWDESYLSSPAFKRKVPIFFGHGGRDSVFDPASQKAFCQTIRQKSAGYPARFVLFDDGSHGTPIRMTDWRETLNWMLTQ
nr:alpha/beta hydrolase [Mesorhizobium sp. NBSH29]